MSRRIRCHLIFCLQSGTIRCVCHARRTIMMDASVCMCCCYCYNSQPLCEWRLFTRQMMANSFFFAQQTKQAHIWLIYIRMVSVRLVLVKDFSIFVYYSSQYVSDIDTMIVPREKKSTQNTQYTWLNVLHVFMTSHGLWVNFRTWKNSDFKRTYLLRSLARSLLEFQLRMKHTN